MAMPSPSPRSPSPAGGPNDEYIECWNRILTPKWIRFRHLLSGNGKVHSDLAYARLDIQRGYRVLDVACGFGDNTLELADRVGPLGIVTGIDCTSSFLDIARNEQEAAGIDNVEYVHGDVETTELPASAYELAVSRFGLMYCASPVRALRAIGRALVPRGEVGLITWRKLSENPCWSVAEQIALKHLPRPGEEAKTCGPGPFSMSDRATNERILEAGGYEDVRVEAIEREICVGRTLAEAIDYQMLVGPAGYVIREAGELGEERAEVIRGELRERFAGLQRADGSVWLGSSTWFVSGRTRGR